ncbi:prickle-like protein 4 [Rhinophrynus dorsalis]
MAPESAASALSATSQACNKSSSDSDSGCALEEYLELQVCPSAVPLTLSSTGTQDLKLIRTLLQLLPPQDCDERFCTALGEQERRELQRFSAHRRLHCMRQGIIVPVTPDTQDSFCVRCQGKITVGDTAVESEQLQGEGLRWHLECFVCETCRLPLLQFIYFLQDGRIYCGRHHAELSRARCAACDQLILSEKCIVAEGHRWHMDHFCCWECEVVLGGSRYVMKGGRPFCNSCFLRLYAETCEACGEPVYPDGNLVTFRGQYWHTLPSCFCCFRCKAPLQMSEIMVDDGHLFCSQDCTPSGSQAHHFPTYQRDFMETSVRTPNLQCNIKRSSILHHFGHHAYTAATKVRTGRGLNLSVHESSIVPICQGGTPALCSDEHIPRLHRQNIADEEEEATSCSSSSSSPSSSSSSSSSDSEPEGFFLGTPMPNYSVSRSSPSAVCRKTSSLKRRQLRKNCKVS